MMKLAEHACLLCSRVDQSYYTMEIPNFYFYPLLFLWDLVTISLILLIQVTLCKK